MFGLAAWNSSVRCWSAGFCAPPIMVSMNVTVTGPVTFAVAPFDEVLVPDRKQLDGLAPGCDDDEPPPPAQPVTASAAATATAVPALSIRPRRPVGKLNIGPSLIWVQGLLLGDQIAIAEGREVLRWMSVSAAVTMNRTTAIAAP